MHNVGPKTDGKRSYVCRLSVLYWRDEGLPSRSMSRAQSIFLVCLLVGCGERSEHSPSAPSAEQSAPALPTVARASTGISDVSLPRGIDQCVVSRAHTMDATHRVVLGRFVNLGLTATNTGLDAEVTMARRTHNAQTAERIWVLGDAPALHELAAASALQVSRPCAACTGFQTLENTHLELRRGVWGTPWNVGVGEECEQALERGTDWFMATPDSPSRRSNATISLTLQGDQATFVFTGDSAPQITPQRRAQPPLLQIAPSERTETTITWSKSIAEWTELASALPSYAETSPSLSELNARQTTELASIRGRIATPEFWRTREASRAVNRLWATGDLTAARALNSSIFAAQGPPANRATFGVRALLALAAGESRESVLESIAPISEPPLSPELSERLLGDLEAMSQDNDFFVDSGYCDRWVDMASLPRPQMEPIATPATYPAATLGTFSTAWRTVTSTAFTEDAAHCVTADGQPLSLSHLGGRFSDGQGVVWSLGASPGLGRPQSPTALPEGTRCDVWFGNPAEGHWLRAQVQIGNDSFQVLAMGNAPEVDAEQFNAELRRAAERVHALSLSLP